MARRRDNLRQEGLVLETNRGSALAVHLLCSMGHAGLRMPE